MCQSLLINHIFRLILKLIIVETIFDFVLILVNDFNINFSKLNVDHNLFLHKSNESSFDYS